ARAAESAAAAAAPTLPLRTAQTRTCPARKAPSTARTGGERMRPGSPGYCTALEQGAQHQDVPAMQPVLWVATAE
ncbi:hypothetical protein NDU88_003216, partial [Pleurodeles waltl]